MKRSVFKLLPVNPLNIQREFYFEQLTTFSDFVQKCTNPVVLICQVWGFVASLSLTEH